MRIVNQWNALLCICALVMLSVSAGCGNEPPKVTTFPSAASPDGKFKFETSADGNDMVVIVVKDASGKEVFREATPVSIKMAWSASWDRNNVIAIRSKAYGVYLVGLTKDGWKGKMSDA